MCDAAAELGGLGWPVPTAIRTHCTSDSIERRTRGAAVRGAELRTRSPALPESCWPMATAVWRRRWCTCTGAARASDPGWCGCTVPARVIPMDLWCRGCAGSRCARIQRRAPGAARARCATPGMAGVSDAGPVGQRRGHDAGGVRGACADRWLAPDSASVDGLGRVAGQRGRRAGVASGTRVDAVAVYTPILGLNAMIGRIWAAGAVGPRHRRAVAVRRRCRR